MFIYRPVYEQVTPEEWNKLMYEYNHTRTIYEKNYCLYEDRKKNPSYKKGSPFQFYLKIKTTKAYLTMKIYNEWKNYLIDLNDKKNYDIPIGTLYRDMTRRMPVKDMNDDSNIYSQTEYDEKGYKYCYVKVTPALHYRTTETYQGVAYGYDMNKAYLNALMHMPYSIDLENPVYRMYDDVKEGEIGFTMDGKVLFDGFAHFVFKMQPSSKKALNYCKFVCKCLRNASAEELPSVKMRYQGVLGNLKHHNIFFYNMIIDYSNKTIAKYMVGGNILSANTDGFISSTPMNNLPMSSKIGEFKLEHQGNIIVQSNGYQWENELPKISGFSANKINLYNEIAKEPFDLIKDYDFVSSLPNMYYLDMDYYVKSNRDVYVRRIKEYEISKEEQSIQDT